MSHHKIVLVITGTPGTGKTTLARFLATELGLKRIDLHAHYPEISRSYDRERQCYVVDVQKVARMVREEKKKAERGVILDSHIAHLLPRRLVDMCIVLTCPDLKLLQRRLRKRGYAAKKIRENLDAEIFQVCLLEAREKHQVLVIDTKAVQKEALVRKIKATLHGKLKITQQHL